MTNMVNPSRRFLPFFSVIESLGESLRMVWLGCTLREFNIGYDCGDKPWAFNRGLSNSILTRIAASGASLRITLYPLRHEKDAEPTLTDRPNE
jgi:hypothetical protein